MKDLLQAYDELVDKHEERVAVYEESEWVPRYAAHDFFSHEPFYHELYNIPKSLAKFYPDQEESRDWHNIYICAVIDRQLMFVRNAFGGDVYYDSFFTYDNNEVWRLELYANGNDKKPVKVEKLVKGEDGRYVSFEAYSENGYQKTNYEYLEKSIKIVTDYYDAKQNFIYTCNMEALFDSSGSSVESIVEYKEDETSVVYDKNMAEASLDDLLARVKKQIVSIVLKDLEKQTVIQEKMDCMLFEYTMQGPFPPTVALDAKGELLEGEAPLSFYNAPDMQYFSEEDLEIDFYQEDRALYDAVNSKFSELYETLNGDDDNEEAHQSISKMAFDAYADICREIYSARTALSKSLPLSDEFHVTARDFEQCNELEFLRVLLPEEQLLKLEAVVQEYDSKSKLSEKDQAELLRLESTLETEGEKHEGLASRLREKSTNSVYSRELLYFLQPFGYECHHYKLNKVVTLSDCEYIVSLPDEGNYYQYILEDDNVMAIMFYRDGELSAEQYFEYTDSSISEWDFQHFSSGLGLQCFSRLALFDGVATSLERYSAYNIETWTYEYCAEGNIYKDVERTCLITEDFANYHESVNLYEYDHRKRVQRITRHFDGDTKSNVKYCCDDSFIRECMIDVVRMAHDSVIEDLCNVDKQDIKAVVLELDDRLRFPFYYYYVLSLNSESSITWQRRAIGHSQWDDNVCVNYSVYTLTDTESNSKNYLLPNIADGYKDLTIKDLIKKLQGSLHDESGRDIKVLFKTMLDTTETIDKMLLESLVEE